MKASSNRPVPPETTPHVGARFIAPWAADNPPSSPSAPAAPAAWPPKGGRSPLGGQQVTDPQSGAGARVGAVHFAAASFAARKPRAAARLADPFADPATQKIWAEEHALAFTVAGMARDDILAALRDGLTEVIAGKLSREEWLEGARARLIKAGYWREEGEKGGITPSRLQLIFDTNTANAYHGGRWQRLEERRETHPYLMYLTKRDHRVRPEHRAWEGLILPIDHPFWQTHFPPNGFRCRCAVLGVTQAEYDQLKRDGGQFAGGTVKFDNDVDADLESLDPGFAYNPGIPGSRAAALQRLAEEKAARAAVRAATIAAQGDSDQSAPSTTPKRTTSAQQDAPAPLVLTKRTDKTSIPEAARDANPHYKEIAEAYDEYKRILHEQEAISGYGDGYMTWWAKDDERDAAYKKYRHLYDAYARNCQRCVVAYELRRQGYDVTALPALGNDDILKKNWDKLFIDQDPVPVGGEGMSTAEALANLEAEIASYGEGSRSIVAVKWKRRKNDKDEDDVAGHVFIAERRNGRTVFVDPQTGKVEYDSWKKRFDPSWVKISRIDGKDPNPQYLSRAVKEGR